MITNRKSDRMAKNIEKMAKTGRKELDACLKDDKLKHLTNAEKKKVLYIIADSIASDLCGELKEHADMLEWYADNYSK